jgi:hypothetical protein
VSHASEEEVLTSSRLNPWDGMKIYIGRRGLLDRLEVLLTEERALAFLTAHPANHVWRVTLDEVTEMATTDPVPPRLIIKE